MPKKPTYEELEAKIQELERVADSRSETSEPDIIRTLSESFQQLADHSQDAIYLFDIESGTFPFFNKRFLALFAAREKGRPVLTSGSVGQHIHPEDVDTLREARKRALAAGESEGDVEYRYIGSDGTTRWMHDRWSVVRDSQNRAVAIEGFIRDITQQKQVEQEHRDKEKLRAILDMAGAVSHELNNPLQVVLIGIEKMAAPNLEPSQKDSLIKLIKKHILRMMELSAKIQKISKYATKDYVQGKKIVDIDAASTENFRDPKNDVN